MSGSWEIVSNRQVLVYFLHTEVVPTAFAMSLRRLIIPGEILPPIAGMPFDHARNSAVQQFLASPFQYLFSIDSDLVVPHDTIIRLLNRRLPIVSGLYCRRSPPHSVPVMIKNGQWVTNYVPGSLVEVDWVGAGCLLVHRSVFEAMLKNPPRPGKIAFDWRVDLRGTGSVPEDTCLSEDFVFNQHAKRTLGVSTYVDTSVVCKHCGYAEFTHNNVQPLNHAA